MFMLWLGTAILSYGSKIPYIKYIISVLSVMYGRTTIWKVLVKLRKIFIMFNAVIGVYMVFKTVGFSYDNLLAGFVGMGHSYLEIFTNFTKRMFHWFVELFDHRIIPNVPGENGIGTGPKSKNIWLPKGIESNSFYPKPNVEESLRKSYNSLFSINVEPAPSSWYKDLPTWLWVGGLIAGGAVIVGTVYVIYKFIQDPLLISNIGNSEGTADAVNAAANVRTTVTPASPGGFEEVVEGSKAFKIVKSISSGLKKLNPAYWFLTSNDTTEAAKAFMSLQQTDKCELKLFPYTAVNPYDSWIKRMRINYLGEFTFERIDRKALAQSFRTAVFAPIEIASQPVASGSGAGTTLQVTPHVATVGLGLSLEQPFGVTAEKLFSVPSTPGLRAISHVMTEDFGNTYEESILNSAVGRLKNLPFVGAVSSPEGGLETVVPSPDNVVENRYSILEVE